LKTLRFLPLLAAVVMIGAGAPNAAAGEPPAANPDKVRVAKFLYESQPAHQDVVVFKYPATSGQSATQNYVKRLIGLPGETVVVSGGTVVAVPGPLVERITVDGGKVEIRGDTIKIEGGKVEIIRQRRE
jgi:signal peptidase I